MSKLIQLTEYLSCNLPLLLRGRLDINLAHHILKENIPGPIRLTECRLFQFISVVTKTTNGKD